MTSCMTREIERRGHHLMKSQQNVDSRSLHQNRPEQRVVVTCILALRLFGFRLSVTHSHSRVRRVIVSFGEQ